MYKGRIQMSPVELMLVVLLIGSLLLAFLQARRDEMRQQ
jgi:hypothetical protein